MTNKERRRGFPGKNPTTGILAKFSSVPLTLPPEIQERNERYGMRRITDNGKK